MTQNNPFADAWKTMVEAQTPNVDVNAIISSSRKNFEVVTAANQVLAEGIQTAARRQAEIAKNNSEKALEVFKEVIGSKDPKESAQRQADFAKTVFEKALSDSRELFEIVTKANSEAYELLGKQVTENINTITKAASQQTKKAAGNKA